MKKFSNAGCQQIQIDVSILKAFLREFLIIDVEDILDGFYLEITKNCGFNCLNPQNFDDSVT